MPFSAQHLKAARLHLMQSDATMKRIIQSVGPFKGRMIPPSDEPRVTDGQLQQIARMGDDEAIECLRQTGMSPVEIEPFLFLSLGRLSVLPLEDAEFVAAAVKVYALPTDGRAELMRLAESWQPYGAIAAWYLKQYVGLQSEPPDA